MGNSERFSHTLSPKVTLDAQLWVFLGGENNLGLSHNQKTALKIIIKLHQASGFMLQIAAKVTGTPVTTRVQTLMGLAWRSQVASSIDISVVKIFFPVELFWSVIIFLLLDSLR